MFQSASNYHHGVNLYLAKNYSVITVEVLFHGYWLGGSIPHPLYCGVFGGLCLSWLECLRKHRKHSNQDRHSPPKTLQ
jgi:hypothetical protein